MTHRESKLPNRPSRCVNRWAIVGALTAAVVLFTHIWPAAASAEADYPSRTITFIVPFPPASATDTVTRVIVEKIRPALGGKLVVENKPGANSQIAVQATLGAAADGYTFFVGGGSTGILGLTNKGFDLDLRKELVGVAGFAANSVIISVNSKLPIRSLKEFVDYAKAHPGVLNYGVHSASDMLANNAFAKALGIDVVNVRYGGSAQVKTALVAGDIHYSVFYAGDIAPHIQSGAVRPIANTGLGKNDDYPNLPSIAEFANTSTHYIPWSGLFAKAGAPKFAIEKVSAAVSEALNDDEVQKKIRQLGSRPMPMKPEQLSKHWVEYIDMWTKVAKESGLNPE
jgi:tripartite-type tricarboxylate transporter receptor subunit TctC